MLLDQYGRPMPPTKRVMQLRASYDAAQTTQENIKHWRWADNLSASAANSQEVRATLRQRSRYEAANNSFAAGIVDTLANDTIATGPRIQINAGAAGRLLEKRWHRWCKHVNLAAKLRTARKAKVVDGEAFLVRTTNLKLRDAVKLDVRLMEADQVESLNGDANGVSGLRFDRWGNVSGYDVLANHPGDQLGVRSLEQPPPLDASHVLHWFRSDRPGQARGIPELTPALPLFAMLRRYTLAVLTTAETAADISALLETQAAPFDEDGNPQVDDLAPFDNIPIDRGMMVSMPRGWKMSQLKAEQPTTQYEMFRNAILNEIARAVNMPANKARCDSSGYNFASGRLDHGTYYAAIDVERAQCETTILDQIFDWWLEEASLVDGYVEGIDSDAERVWYWDPHASGDPTKEANALATVHALGLIDEDAYLLNQGIDPESFWKRRREQIERRREMGLPPAQYYLNPDEMPEPAAA